MQEDDLKIDVGEADEQEQEIDLDAEPIQEQPDVIEVEELDDDYDDQEPVAETSQKEELEDYSDGVKKRIAKLTRKMREAERQKEEAITYAQSVQSEAQQLKNRYNNLDSNYAREFETRVKSSLSDVQNRLKQAIADGDVDTQVKAQAELADLSMDASRLSRLKETQKITQEATQNRANTAPQQVYQQPAPRTDPKADTWASENPWFGSDNAMTYTAFDIHKELVETEGFDPQSDDYYEEVDKRIRLEFPHKFDIVEQSTEQPAQNVASARRPASNKGRRKTVRLTPSQVAISKRLGVPLEEYAKQLAAKEV